MNKIKIIGLIAVLIIAMASIVNAETLNLVQKDNNWVEVTGGATATLTYNPVGQTFNYNIEGTVPDKTITDYSLIYYKDQLTPSENWGLIGAVIISGIIPNVDTGVISKSGSSDIGTIPQPDDINIGAKIWLIPTSNIHSMTMVPDWQPTEYLFESNLRDVNGNELPATSQLITYTKDATPPTITPPSTSVGGEATSPSGMIVTYEATATDNIDGTITPICIPASGSVFPIGTTVVDCTAVDISGNIGTSRFNVVVTDTTPPSITAPADITIAASGVLTIVPSIGYPIVSDIADPNPLITSVSNPNVDIEAGFPIGTTTITWTATDYSGNHASATQTITIVDNTPPVITLIGMNPVIVEVGTTYSDDGASAIDNSGELISVTSTSDLSIRILGTYHVTYTAQDSSGNIATPIVRTVNIVDTIPPVITLNGDSHANIAINSEYNDDGVTVTDNYNTGLVATVTGHVDTTTAGIYTLKYNVADSSGNTATEVKRTVRVYGAGDSGTTLSGWHIDINTPTDGMKISSKNVYVGYTLTSDDVYAGTVVYKLDDGSETTIPDDRSQIQLNGLSEGEHIVVIYVTGLNSGIDEILSSFTFVVDTVPPHEVTGLMHYDITSSSITWAWNNPYDTDFVGTVITITKDGEPVEATINGETMLLDHVPIPANIGVTQEVIISDLEAGTTYKILVQTEDDAESQP